MNPGSVLTLCLALTIYIILGLVATWAWTTRQWFLAVPLTIVFIGACVGMICLMERWGT